MTSICFHGPKDLRAPPSLRTLEDLKFTRIAYLAVWGWSQRDRHTSSLALSFAVDGSQTINAEPVTDPAVGPIAGGANLSEVLDLDALWLRFSDPRPPTTKGIFDWIGDFYPFGSFPSGPPPHVPVVATPVNSDGFRAGPIEWAAFALAVQLTIDESGPASMIECGASQGLWALPWIRVLGSAPAKKSKNPLRRNVTALAIEASASQIQAREFWEAQDLGVQGTVNGKDLRFRDKQWEANWIQRAVVAKDGPVFFPKISVDTDNGAQATDSTSDIDVRGMPVEYDRVEGVRLGSLISRQDYLDFLHLDLQGTELEMLRSGEFECLRSRVGVVLLGTHSRASEDEALRIMPQLGFTLLAEETCQFTQVLRPNPDEPDASDYRTALIVDGEQFWVSKSVLSRGRAAGLIRVA